MTLPNDTRPYEKFDDPVRQAEWDALTESQRDSYRLTQDEADRDILRDIQAWVDYFKKARTP